MTVHNARRHNAVLTEKENKKGHITKTFFFLLYAMFSRMSVEI